MFGSWAKGRADEGSDIDVALFLDQDDLDGFDADARLMKLRRSVDLRIEPRAFARTDEDVPDPFVKEIIATGERFIWRGNDSHSVAELGTFVATAVVTV